MSDTCLAKFFSLCVLLFCLLMISFTETLEFDVVYYLSVFAFVAIVFSVDVKKHHQEAFATYASYEFYAFRTKSLLLFELFLCMYP